MKKNMKRDVYICITESLCCIVEMYTALLTNYGGGGGLVANSCPTLVIPGTVAARFFSLSMGFSRQEYWSGLPFPSPGDLPNLGMEPVSLRSPALAGGFFTASATWEATHGEVPLLSNLQLFGDPSYLTSGEPMGK